MSMDLQFINLDGADEEDKQTIINILYGEKTASTVEFPWELPPVSVSKCTKNEDTFQSSEPSYTAEESPHSSEGMIYRSTFPDPGYPLVYGCNLPVHQPLQVMQIQEPMMSGPVFAHTSDSKMYVPNTYGHSKMSEKADGLDHKGRRNKKKQLFKEKSNYHEPKSQPQLPPSYNMVLEEYSLSPNSHLASYSTPVSLSATDMSQQHVSYPCVMAPTFAPSYPGIGPFYTGPSQMYYHQNGPVYVYPGMYHANYQGHPASNYTHIVPTEQLVPPEPLDKVTNIEIQNPVFSVSLNDVMNKPISKQVPIEFYSQEKLVDLEVSDSPIEINERATIEPQPNDVCIADDNTSDALYDTDKQCATVAENVSCKIDNSAPENTNSKVISAALPASPPTEPKTQSVAPTVVFDSKKTYASLFKRESSPQNSVSKTKLVNHCECTVTPNKENGVVSGLKDTVPAELKELLSSVKLDHHSVHFVPRGLSNKGNWCYINATLQALLACPPFHNLMKSLPTVIGLKKENSISPVTEAVVEFVNEFAPLEHFKKTAKSKISLSKTKDELMFGEPFEPKYIFDMLQKSKRDDFAKGRQEDAEEFLTWMLNQVHEEMVKIKSSCTKESNLKNGDISTPNGEILSNGDDTADDDWQTMGPKNKSCATRSLESTPSPIVDIFGGEICSVLQHPGFKSQTLEPFFTLQLDIQNEKVGCIKSALEGLTVKEALEGYTCSTTNQEIEASRSITLQKLPSVLILHLKRFVYHDGVIKKLLKRIDFDFTLELSKDLLSHVGRLEKNKIYKLFAVVYHDGQDAAKGHYIADVYHGAYGCWLRADDSKLKSIADDLVLKHDSPRVPYLLYYRRDDTIV